MFIPNPHPALAELAPNGQPKVDFLAWYNDGFVIDDRNLLAGRPDLITIKLLPESRTQPTIAPGLAILHTQGGSAKASNSQLWSYLNNETVRLEPHVIGPQMADGKVIQAMPFTVRADCNSDANQFMRDGKLTGAVSMETQDSGSNNVPLNNDPWTLIQLHVNASVLTAVCATYGVHCTAPAWYRDNGIGHHSQFPEWSSAGHNCPGNARIRQMDWIRGEVAKRLANYYPAVGMNCPG